MDIRINIEGAQPDEISRGLQAAQAVFDQAGVTANHVAWARFNVEGWDIRGFTGEVPEADLAIFHLWDEADEAAVRACCAGWPAERILESANLELIRRPPR